LLPASESDVEGDLGQDLTWRYDLAGQLSLHLKSNQQKYGVSAAERAVAVESQAIAINQFWIAV
jgi:hypothetical protein